jgi:hypothetical protein
MKRSINRGRLRDPVDYNKSMKDLKTQLNLAGDEHWPTIPVITVPGDDYASPIPPRATQPEGEKVVETWHRVAILEVIPASEAYWGFMAGDHMQFMNVPVTTSKWTFRGPPR